MAMLFSILGNAPVITVNAAGSTAGTRLSAEPFDKNPVSATGLSTTSVTT